MPWQLIYTSAPRGLLSGQSGFCTVARSADLREALVQRLEQISSYHYLRVAEASVAGRNPVISAFRLLDLRGTKYHVLTRIQPSGLDFTARTNHLAHHVIFQNEELPLLPSPAAILRHWPGWVSIWQGEARWLDPTSIEEFLLRGKSFLPARRWAQMTGDGGRAAGLLESECVRGCYLVCPDGSEEKVLELYCETLQLLNFNGQFPLRPWRHTFTTFMQAEDNPGDFQWRGCQENTPAHKLALTRSAPLIALSSVRVPGNSLVKLAREEPKSAPPPSPPKSGGLTPPPTALSLRRNDLSTRTVSAPAPIFDTVRIRKPAEKEGINLWIGYDKLWGMAIFAIALAGLFFAYNYLKRPSPKPMVLTPPAMPKSLSVSVPARKETTTAAMPPDTNQLACLNSDGPTFVIAVSNLSSFSLPIDTIVPFQNFLHRYDKLEPGALPNDIRLEVATDHWDCSPGVPLKVAGRESPQFLAQSSGFQCIFDYSESLAPNRAPVAVQTKFDVTPSAFSLHFGFAAATNGDPFRLLVINVTNPPKPLHFSSRMIQFDRPDFRSSLDNSLRDILLPSFHLLEGRQWQLQPFIYSDSWHYLYQDWPPQSVPAFGHELDFTDVRKSLQKQRDELKSRLKSLAYPLGRPIGQFLESGDHHLESFLAYSGKNLVPGQFLNYLDDVRRAAPKKTWIKKWRDEYDVTQPDQVAGSMEELYDLWCSERQQDQALVTVTNAGVVTNYFFYAWQLLKQTASIQGQFDKVQEQLGALDHFAYVGLCIFDPRQPRPGLEMARFDKP